MSKYIAIIVAETEELEAIKDIMTKAEEIEIYNLKVYLGKIENKNCVLAKSGVGKVNAARTTQILTDKFNLNYIINTGVAGGLNDKLNIGDIVIGKELIQHDFDVTVFGREKGHIPETGKIFKSNRALIEKCKKIKLENIKIMEGIIASGDIFCSTKKMKEKIRNKFNSDCVEMEGAAIAQVCYLNKVPFVVIRSISDVSNGKNQIEFKNNLEFATKNCAKLIQQISTID